MTEAEWLTCEDPAAMLLWMDEDGHDPRRDKPHRHASDRKLRLFACACCRQVWHLLTDERSRNAVEVAERYADGQCSNGRLLGASERARRALADGSSEASAAAMAERASDLPLCNGQWDRFLDSAAVAGLPRATVAALLREVAGNPFAVPADLPRTAATLSLARQIYAERDFDLIGLLRDALMDGGCDDEAALSHCLELGHVRGCWLIDRLLEKS